MKSLAALIILLIWGCSTDLKVKPYKPMAEGSIDGIPFRVPAAHTIRIYKMNESSGRYELVHRKTANLPATDQLYTLNYSASFLANPNFELTFAPDNTLKSILVEGESSADKLLSSVATQTVAAGNAITDFENTKRAAQKANITSENDLMTAQTAALSNQLNYIKALAAVPDYNESSSSNQEARLQAALKARLDIETAERELAKAKDEDAPNIEGRLRLLKLVANSAYRKAGLAEPYPGVFP